MPRRTEKPPGFVAREAAVSLLDAVLDQGEMLSDAPIASTGPERAEARGLADLTLRRLGQIDDLLTRFVDRPPKGTGRQILRLMTAELVFAGTAAHAAVDMAVRLAQAGRGTNRLAGLINAVGRKLAREGADMVKDQDAARMNMAPWLMKRLTADWGADTAHAIAAAHLTIAPHDLSLKVLGDIEPLASETGGAVLPTGSLRLPNRPQISTLPGYDDGAWWVQDAAAALPVQLLGDVAGKDVLDLCAAPGGKTLQLAAAGANVTAVDQSEHRLARTTQNLARTDLQATLVEADLLDWQPSTPAQAVLLDAPCSATGTLRRHPDLQHRTDGKRMQSLLDLQANLLDRAFSWLAPGGTLVMCTCSLLKTEGEDQATAFLDRTPEAELVPVRPDEMPTAFISDQGMLRTRPDHWPEFSGLDGFFAMRVVRRM